MTEHLIRTALETLLSQHVTKKHERGRSDVPFALLPEVVDGDALVKGIRLLLKLMEEVKGQSEPFKKYEELLK